MCKKADWLCKIVFIKLHYFYPVKDIFSSDGFAIAMFFFSHSKFWLEKAYTSVILNLRYAYSIVGVTVVKNYI